ncbi:hypothetical protein [uncultured Sphingomonas sp.]|uniref:hypothetical protein n=1 Tax=uncultured Sphingomonas sp. TaxID=158754 RepID=UPI0026370704|nr:hypothetical protein [uncultured Sphingomonas sp.]
MATNEPNNAQDVPETPREEGSAAAILSDAQMDSAPGGGLGGASAADVLSGSGRTPGGTAPNAPIDTGVDAGDRDADAEARVRAVDGNEAEGHPS